MSSGDVRDMLGAADQGVLLRLLDAVAAGDGPGVMTIADEMQARSLSFDAALQDLAGFLLRIALAQTAPSALAAEAPEREQIAGLAGRIDPESVQLYYQIALQGRDDLPRAPDEHAGFAMTLLRMLAFRPEGAEKAAAPGNRAAAPATASASEGDWPALVRQLAVTGAARELARNSELRRQDGNLYELALPKGLSHLADKAYQDKLRAALEQHLGRPVKVAVAFGETAGKTAAAREIGEREANRAEAEREMQGDAAVRDLVDLFDGKVVDVRRK